MNKRLIEYYINFSTVGKNDEGPEKIKSQVRTEDFLFYTLHRKIQQRHFAMTKDGRITELWYQIKYLITASRTNREATKVS